MDGSFNKYFLPERPLRIGQTSSGLFFCSIFAAETNLLVLGSVLFAVLAMFPSNGFVLMELLGLGYVLLSAFTMLPLSSSIFVVDQIEKNHSGKNL